MDAAVFYLFLLCFVCGALRGHLSITVTSTCNFTDTQKDHYSFLKQKTCACVTCAVSSKMSSSSEEADPGCEESELPSSSSYRILFT